MTLRALLILSLLLPFTGCDNLGTKQGSILGNNVPGLGDMWAPSKEEKAEEDWWGKYYGQKTTPSE